MLSLTLTVTSMTREGLAVQAMEVAKKVMQGHDFEQNDRLDGSISYFDVKRHKKLSVIRAESDGDGGPEVA